MKCLPETKLVSANGMILHDWHAEIVTIRAFNRYLLEECKAMLLGGDSRYLQRRLMCDVNEQDAYAFEIKQDVRLHMYCSEAPC